MSGLRNPFGVRHGELITVEDLDPEKEYGLKCNCTCPNCERAFQAKCLREGSQKAKHFSHYNTIDCDVNIVFLKSIYLLLKEYIDRRTQEKNALFLPDIVIRFDLDGDISEKGIRYIQSIQNEQTDILVKRATSIIFDCTEICYDEKGFPQALVAIKGDHKLAFVVEPPEICSGRVKLKKHENYATIQIGFLTDESIFSSNKKDQLLQLIDDKWRQVFWIHNPKWIDVKEDIFKRQTEYQNWKRQEQERRERERQERERKEQERRERERQERERKEQERRECERQERERQEQEHREREKHEQEQLQLQNRKPQYQQRKQQAVVIDQKQDNSHSQDGSNFPDESILKKLNNQNKIAIDSNGKRWQICESCSFKGPSERYFIEHESARGINYGLCRECAEKSTK